MSHDATARSAKSGCLSDEWPGASVPKQRSGSPRARINAGFLCFSSWCSGLSHLGQPFRNIWEGAHPLLCSKTLLYCAKASSPGMRLVPVSHERLRPPEPSPQEGGGKGV